MRGNAPGINWHTGEDDSTLARKVGGTCKQGDLAVGYHTLVAKFGHPTAASADGSTRFEWHIEFQTDDGKVVIATVYDWYSDVPAGQITDWCIGGRDSDAYECVLRALWDVIGVGSQLQEAT
jgi:hypothetical protein